jgi:hypothetical protein
MYVTDITGNYDDFSLSESLVKKVQNILEGKNPLNEVSPPNPKIEKWIKANKGRFEKEYGAEKGKEVLYAKAWTMHNEELEKEKKIQESIMNEVSPPDPKIEHWIKSNKGRFEKEYGAEKGKEVLYSKAWKMHNEALEEELEEEKKTLKDFNEFDPNDREKEKEEKGGKKREKITFNPVVEPEKIAEPDKITKI